MACKNTIGTSFATCVYDPKLCIICQKATTTSSSSTKNGIKQVRDAAIIRKDIVADRINKLDASAGFVYHLNNACYKSYTNSGHLKRISAKYTATPTNDEEPNSSDEADDSSNSSQRQTRSNSTPRAPPSSNKDPKYEIKCIVCRNFSHKKVFDKSKICEDPRADHFLSAAKFFQDEVYTEIADLQTSSILIPADLFAHKTCIRKYLQTFDRENAKNDKPDMVPAIDVKQLLFERAVRSIDQLLQEGKCCTISELVEFLMGFLEEGEELNSPLRTRDVRGFLEKHYGNDIKLIANTRANESHFLYSSSISPEALAVKIKNQNIVEEAGKMIRKELLATEFGLKDRFGDETDLKNSWENVLMPDCLLTFFAALFKIPKSKLFKQSIGDLNNLFKPPEGDDDDAHEENIPIRKHSTRSRCATSSDLSESSRADLYDDDEETDSDTDEDDGTYRGGGDEINNRNDKEDKWTPHQKSVQLHCFFQILAYSLHNGTVMTPFHSMVGHSLYSSNRSRNELTTFNRVGISPSYNTVRRARNLLESYAFELSEDGNVPIPTHFTRSGFTMGAFDNADYSDKSSLAGTDSKHYASMVLFQDSSETPLNKPPVSSTKATNKVSSATQLPCQVVDPYVKPLVRPDLASDMLLSPENCTLEHLDTDSARRTSSNIEFSLHLIRTGLSETSLLWAAARVLISTSSIPLMRVGFLPVIPKPITNPATVHKALNNFENVRKQLDQAVLPIWCDDGVFSPAMDIILSKPERFKNILLMLGPFHWTKVLLRCAGRLFAGSGIDDSLKECAVFGPNVLDSVINGGHYIRSLTGVLMIEDMIYKLMWQEFWLKHDKSSYPCIDRAEMIKTLFEKKKRCPEEFEALRNEIGELSTDFSSFKAECESRSEVCQYFGVWLRIASIIKNAVAADREGNWDLLVSVVEDSMPILAKLNCINYLRHGAWYLECIKVLEKTHPDVYRRFSLGQWAIQERSGWFCGIGCDMKLEQTIQKVSKGPGGHFVAGQTHKERSVAQFELLFHEIVSITNLFQSVTSKKSDNRTECNLGNNFAPGKTNLFNNNVVKLIDFVNQRGNPYNLKAPSPLHNIITNQSYPENVTGFVLNIITDGEKIYKEFRKTRLVEKSLKLSAKITKQPQLLLTHQTKTVEDPKKDEEITAKDLAVAQRNIEMAKQRGYSMAKILTYDVLPQSPLFQGDYPAKPNKSVLVSEVEDMIPLFEKSTWEKNSDLNTHVILDFMSSVRQSKVTQCLTLGSLCEHTLSSAMKFCTQDSTTHVVFDSYIELSLKECERNRRAAEVQPIDIIGMTPDTMVPQQIEKFWASTVNKQNLQALMEVVVSRYTRPILLSSVIVDNELRPAKFCCNGQTEDIDSISHSWLEEADERLILHVGWAVEEKRCERVIVVSNDTDTFALLLYYLPYLKDKGLKELWQQFGTAEKKRMIPLHDMLRYFGESFCKFVLKAHVLTGDDTMSKVGTKKAALQCGDLVGMLQGFSNNGELTETEMNIVEEFLVRVWSGVRKTTSKTFDCLRLEYYTCYSQGIDGLPPTSSVVKGHIRRGAFSLRRKCSIIGCTNSLQEESPEESGWHIVFGMFLPKKNLCPLPDEMIVLCNCDAECKTKRCKCFKVDKSCVMFCHGKKQSPCLNVKN